MVDAAVLSDFSKWLAATSLSHTIQTTGWIIPALQTIHILCVAVLFLPPHWSICGSGVCSSATCRSLMWGGDSFR